ERAGSIAPETSAGLNFEQPVNGESVHACAFAETFGGASRRRAEEAFDLFRAQDREDRVEQSGFAHARAAGDDENAMLERCDSRLALGRPELFACFCLGPGDRLFEIDLRITGPAVNQIENRGG